MVLRSFRYLSLPKTEKSYTWLAVGTSFCFYTPVLKKKQQQKKKTKKKNKQKKTKKKRTNYVMALSGYPSVRPV